MKELVYTDSKFRAETETAIQKALQLQQNVLNVWNSLNIGECTDLFRLVHDPFSCYREATNNEAPVAGSYRVGAAFLEITDVLLPNSLYVACRTAKQCIMTGHKDLYSIQDGKTVVLNQDAVNTMLNSHNLYAENTAQKEFIQACTNLVESNNSLIPVLQSTLTMKSGVTMPVRVTAAGFQFLQQLEIDTEAINELIKTL